MIRSHKSNTRAPRSSLATTPLSFGDHRRNVIEDLAEAGDYTMAEFESRSSAGSMHA
jgi:hypothetical protein